jgi:hypothetical protein
MKRSIRWAAIAVAMATCAVASAAQPVDEHAGHHPPEADQAAKPGASTAAPAMAGGMQSSLKAMQDQMAKIQASKDPAERQALLKQHMESMQRHMEMMKSMMGKDSAGGVGAKQGGMQAGGMNCGAMMGGGDMMQSMMQQMQQHLEAQGRTSPLK